MTDQTSADEASPRARRGRLRVYLGAAPGVGKTYAMLDEARRRQDRGVDVVVGLVETHDRPHTAALLDGLEVVPRRPIDYRGSTFAEMDLDAVLARNPTVVLVDELAHTNVPGSRHDKRWQDVEEILAAGIDVVTTVNIQHLESLRDVVASITGVQQQETLPDDVVRRADQIELVDMSPEALRRRLAHGNVYRAEKVDAALARYFRVGNLTALRELALLWTADRVEDALEVYRREQGIDATWPTRERVVVAVTGGPESETLIRRAARIARRASGGEVMALHVLRGDGVAGVAPDSLVRLRTLAESLGASWHTVLADDVAPAVLDFSRGVNASQILLGVTRRPRLAAALSPGIGTEVIRGSGDIDVLVVTHEHAGRGPARRVRRAALPRHRLITGWALAVAGPPALAAGLLAVHRLDALPTVLMLFLALTVGVAITGGLRPALLAALASGLLSNYLFTPPVRTWTVAEPQNAVAILVLLAVAVAVSGVVDLAARRTHEAVRARREADALTTIARGVLRGGDVVPTLLEHLREALRVDAVVLEQREDSADRWCTTSRADAAVPGGGGEGRREGEGEHVVPVSEHLRLRLLGGSLAAPDLRLAAAVGQQVDGVLERDRLRLEARASRAERERGAMRTALLAAVSHDLRTPLAAIKAGMGAVRAAGTGISPADRQELLEDVDINADRLQLLIDNLLDMSRLDAGAVTPRLDLVALDEVVPRAVDSVPVGAVTVDVRETLPLIRADAGLLERALANLVENAVRHTPAGTPVRVGAQCVGEQLIIRVTDHGPGVPEGRKEQMFTAFQRLGDAPRGQGLGLGLAVARGFVEANGGTLEAEDTPGGGLTMVISLPLTGESR